MSYEFIEGGVCAPEGFTASGVHCGFKKSNKGKKDLALIKSQLMCTAAAVYTQNMVKGAPLAVTRVHLADGKAIAVIINSGNANTCTPNGVQIAEQTCALTAAELGCDPADVIVASTGVIGQPMSIEPFERGVPQAVRALSTSGSQDAATAIMTTDTFIKQYALELLVDGKTCRIGAIAKGSGMINPNMATMLGFITTDAAIESALLASLLSEDVEDSFNQVSVDGDTSTNDMVCMLANGLSGVCIQSGKALAAFKEALHALTVAICRDLARDGEGATKLLTCRVINAPSKLAAQKAAKAVISSNLFKSAMFGQDANWGRALCALGYSGGEFDINLVDVSIVGAHGRIEFCKNAMHNDFSEQQASEVLKESELLIEVDMKQGPFSASAWGCDLTLDYVRINSDYRS